MPIQFISDLEMYERILNGCRQKRLDLNMTQSELAKRSGLSLRTIKGFEQGQAVNFLSLAKILRALGEFQRLENLVIESPVSPKLIFQSQEKDKRKRARRATS